MSFLSHVPLALQRVAVFSDNKSSRAGWPLLFTGGGGDHSKLARLNLRIWTAPVELTPHGPGLFFRDPRSSGPLFLFSAGRDRGGSDDTPAPPQGAMSRRGLLALAS